jgi:hypothetical protein
VNQARAGAVSPPRTDGPLVVDGSPFPIPRYLTIAAAAAFDMSDSRKFPLTGYHDGNQQRTRGSG